MVESIVEKDADSVLLAFSDGVELWNTGTGTRLATLVANVPVRALAANHARDVLVVGDSAGHIREFGLLNNAGMPVAIQCREWAAHSGSVTALAMSADGVWLVSSGVDDKLRAWNRDAGKMVGESAGHQCTTIVFPPRTSTTVFACVDGDVRSIGVPSMELRWQTQLPTSICRSVDVSNGEDRLFVACQTRPGGNRGLSGGPDNRAVVLRASDGVEAMSLKGHAQTVTVAQGAADGKRVITMSHDGTVRVWDLNHGTHLVAGIEAVPATMRGVDFVSKTGALALTGVDDHMYVFPSELSSPTEIEGIASRIGESDSWIASSEATEQAVRGCPLLKPASVACVKRKRDGFGAETDGKGDLIAYRRLPIGDAHTELYMADAHSGANLWSILPPADIQEIRFSTDGNRVVCARGSAVGPSGTPARARCLPRADRATDVQKAQITDDGQYVISASSSAQDVWWAKSGEYMRGWNHCARTTTPQIKYSRRSGGCS